MEDMTQPADEQRPHLSITQVGMYLRCSMQYWFRYIHWNWDYSSWNRYANYIITNTFK
jgi:hypothetical protein